MKLSQVSMVIVTSLAPLVGACSLILSTSSVQCLTNADCASLGLLGSTCMRNTCVRIEPADTGMIDTGLVDTAPIDTAPPDPKWGCLGSIVKYPPIDPSKTVTILHRYVDLSLEKPIVGIGVRACPVFGDCAKPYFTGSTDADGQIRLVLPKYFSGYLELASPPAGDMVPSIQYLGTPPAKDDLELPPIEVQPHMIGKGDLAGLYALVRAKEDLTLGSVLGIVTDCSGRPAAGVTISVGTRGVDTVTYYTDASRLPSDTRTETSERGECGFVNLPPGTVTITATANVVSKKLGSFTVSVKPGYVTYLPMQPTPSP